MKSMTEPRPTAPAASGKKNSEIRGRLSPMFRRYRRLIALTLIPSVFYALTWSVGASVLADEIAGSQAIVASFDAGAPGHTDMPGTNHFEKSCNHGCHAAGHLLGQVGEALTLPIGAPGEDARVPSPLSFPVSPSDDPFRPPRTSSLA
jgi:hypothetical protein